MAFVAALPMFLGSSFNVFLAGFMREHNAVVINDKIFDRIEELVYKYADEDVPDISNAKLISCLVLMYKDEINIEFEDGTSYRFYLEGAISDLRKYIMKEGYNCYFHSEEFLHDALPLAFSGSVELLCIIYLILDIRKNMRNEEISNGI